MIWPYTMAGTLNSARGAPPIRRTPLCYLRLARTRSFGQKPSGAPGPDKMDGGAHRAFHARNEKVRETKRLVFVTCVWLTTFCSATQLERTHWGCPYNPIPDVSPSILVSEQGVSMRPTPGFPNWRLLTQWGIRGRESPAFILDNLASFVYMKTHGILKRI